MSRINTNVPAIQAIHQLISNQKGLTTSLERLSTGLRINRGADDPAGLIASESLRAEIRGLDAAISNSERAINVISTADAALSEVSSLLREIKGLVVQTANDGALSDDEISANQLQVDSLLESIGRIANSTQFNGKKLLNGELSYTISGQDAANLARVQLFGARVPPSGTLAVTLQVTQSAQTAQLTIAAGASGLSGSALSAGNDVTLEVRGNLGTEVLTFTSGASLSAIVSAVTANATTTGVSAALSGATLVFNSREFGSNQFVAVNAINGVFGTAPGDQGDIQDNGRDAEVFVNGRKASVVGLVASTRSGGLDLVAELTQAFGTSVGSDTFSVTGGGANFQIGPIVNTDGRVSIGIPSLSTTNLGDSAVGFLSSLSRGGSASLLDTENLGRAQEILASAVSQVAVLSGRLGGFQSNQVETNLNSLRVALENVTASESSIRDTDFASEVSSLTRAQILQQSTLQTLGLAIQIPQSVLSLLG